VNFENESDTLVVLNRGERAFFVVETWLPWSSRVESFKPLVVSPGQSWMSSAEASSLEWRTPATTGCGGAVIIESVAGIRFLAELVFHREESGGSDVRVELVTLVSEEAVKQDLGGRIFLGNRWRLCWPR
jgi:hypothetical protein